MIQEKNINTVRDLVDFLLTLDQDRPICGEYIVHYFGVKSCQGYKERPLLTSLIEDRGYDYKFKAMIY